MSASPRGSAAWRVWFPVMYRFLRLLDPLIRSVAGTIGLGNVVELRVRGQRSGRSRSVTVGVLRAGDGLYLGHPNGHAAWTRNLLAAGEAELAWAGGVVTPISVRLLPPGEERRAAILATSQHPFPGNLIYRLARRHVLAAGVYFRVEPAATPPRRAAPPPHEADAAARAIGGAADDARPT